MGLWDKNGSSNLGQQKQRPAKSGLCLFGWPQGKTEGKQNKKIRDKDLELAWGLKKTMESEKKCDTDCNWYSRYSHQRIGTETIGLRVTETKRTSRDHPNYSIVDIGLDT